MKILELQYPEVSFFLNQIWAEPQLATAAFHFRRIKNRKKTSGNRVHVHLWWFNSTQLLLTSSTSIPNPAGSDMALDISSASSVCSEMSSIISCTSSTSLRRWRQINDEKSKIYVVHTWNLQLSPWIANHKLFQLPLHHYIKSNGTWNNLWYSTKLQSVFDDNNPGLSSR